MEDQAQEIMATHARAVEVPALKALFPAVARSRLQEMRARWCDEHRPRFERLCWTRPGSVWAMGFTHCPCLIDGVFPCMLLVRDLASRVTLMALPCPEESAQTVAAMASRVIGMDDTVMPMQEPGAGQTKKARMWVYVGD